MEKNILKNNNDLVYKLDPHKLILIFFQKGGRQTTALTIPNGYYWFKSLRSRWVSEAKLDHHLCLKLLLLGECVQQKHCLPASTERFFPVVFRYTDLSKFMCFVCLCYHFLHIKSPPTAFITKSKTGRSAQEEVPCGEL